MLQTIGYEILDGDDTEIFPGGKLLQLRHARHSTVFVKYFNEAGRGVQTRHTGQIYSSLRVSGPGQYATVLSIERIDMPGTPEGLGTARRICQSTYSSCTVVAGNTGGAAFELVDGNRKGRAQHARILLYLKVQIKFFATFEGNRRAKHTTPATQHEVDSLRGHELGGHNEVSLIFTVFVIDDYHEFALTEVLECFLDSG